MSEIIAKATTHLSDAWQQAREGLGRACRAVSTRWLAPGTVLERERRTKMMMVGGLATFVVAVMVLLLFVLPAMQMAGTPSAAQAPPGAPGAPGMPPPGAPTAGGPGASGMPPGAPSGPGGPGAAGGPGAPAASAGAGAAPAAAAAPVNPPLEPARANPFGAVGVAKSPVATTKVFQTHRTKYGPVWSHFPITLRVGDLRPERPAHPAPLPSATEIGVTATGARMRISSILWSEGSPLATYETPTGETGTVGPGDMIGNYKVIEIGRDYVIVQDTKTIAPPQRLSLKTSQ